MDKLLDRIPRYHSFIEEGVPEEIATEWHDAIMLLESHAKNMAGSIEATTDHLRDSACYFREACKGDV